MKDNNGGGENSEKKNAKQVRDESCWARVKKDLFYRLKTGQVCQRKMHVKVRIIGG
jgi:hypothetical protein